MTTLAPMSLGDLLDGSFALLRRNFATLAGISAICYGPFQAISLYAQTAGGWVEHPFILAAGLLVASVGSLLGAAAIVKVISDDYLGRSATIGSAFAFAGSRMGGLFIAGFAKYLLIGLATLCLIIPGIIVACGYAVVNQVVVLEDLNAPTDALGRSWSLTKGHRGTALGLAFVLGLVASIPGMIAGMLSLSSFATPALVVGTIGALLLAPLVPCGMTLFYYNLRVRKEAFDLEILQQLLAAPTA